MLICYNKKLPFRLKKDFHQDSTKEFAVGTLKSEFIHTEHVSIKIFVFKQFAWKGKTAKLTSIHNKLSSSAGEHDRAQ